MPPRSSPRSPRSATTSSSRPSACSTSSTRRRRTPRPCAPRWRRSTASPRSRPLLLPPPPPRRPPPRPLPPPRRSRRRRRRPRAPARPPTRPPPRPSPATCCSSAAGATTSSAASSSSGTTSRAGTSTPRTRVARTASRRRCPAARWPRPAPTGSRTPPRRSRGASATSPAATARRAVPGTPSTRRAGTDPSPTRSDPQGTPSTAARSGAFPVWALLVVGRLRQAQLLEVEARLQPPEDDVVDAPIVAEGDERLPLHREQRQAELVLLVGATPVSRGGLGASLLAVDEREPLLVADAERVDHRVVRPELDGRARQRVEGGAQHPLLAQQLLVELARVGPEVRPAHDRGQGEPLHDEREEDHDERDGDHEVAPRQRIAGGGLLGQGERRGE